jgi:hypothetical protein
MRLRCCSHSHPYPRSCLLRRRSSPN